LRAPLGRSSLRRPHANRVTLAHSWHSVREGLFPFQTRTALIRFFHYAWCGGQ